MKQRSLPTFALAAGLCLAGSLMSAGMAQATPNLDPFRAPRSNPLDPVRTSQTPAPPPAAPAPAKPAAPPQVCTSDAQCPTGTICEQGYCRPVERGINVLLFRKEGPTTYFLPLYFARRGVPGYRVFAPFYFHFWGTEDKSRIVAPFYWHFEDHLKRRTVTVVIPYVHTEEPGAESWAIWPLFYRSTKFGWAAPLLGSFKIETPEEKKSWGLYAFLYLWSRSPQKSWDVAIPLFASKRSEASAFTWTLPLNFYWRSGSDKNLLVPPLFYYGSDPKSSTFASLFGYRSSAEGGASKGSFLWVYWYGRRSDSNYDVLLPLVWSFRSPQSNTTVLFPLVLHFRRAESRFNAVLPLWYSASNDKKGTGFSLFLPFFFSKHSDFGRSHMWLTPLGGYKRDDEQGSSALTFIIPPLIYRRDSQHEFSTYLFLYWRYRDIPGNSSTTVVGPYYTHDDPTGSTRVGIPLFYYFRDAATGASAHTFIPLYFRRKSPDDTTTAAGVFPLWVYYRSFRDGWSAGFMPLFYFGKRADKQHALILPLFYHLKDRRSSATVAFPFYYRFTDQHHTSAGVPPLLYFHGRDHESTYHVQVPAFWRFRDGEKGITTTVVPPIFYRSRPDGWSAGVAPLLFFGGGGPRGHFVLFPLFWRFRDDTADRSTVVFLNYMHRRHGGQVTDAFFPLLHWRRGAPPGGTAETSFTFFPFVHYRSGEKRTVFVSPVGAWGRSTERKVGLIPPYFWYQSRQIAAQGVPPLWFDVTTLRTGERTRIFGPFFAMDAPGRSARILFPLVARYRDQKESGTYVFPTYFRRRTNEGYALDTLFPLFWISSSPGHSTAVVGPFFRTTSPGGGSVGLLPLFAYANNPKRRIFFTPLFIQHQNYENGTGRTFGILYFSSYNPDGHTRVVFPLWWSGSSKESSHQVLFPLYWHFANSRENKSFSLFGPFLWSRNGVWRTRGLMPVAWYSRNDQGTAGSNAVVPLFYEKHGPATRLFVTALFGFSTAPDRDWFYVGPFYYRNGWSKSFWMLFPLWFSHFDKVTETHTRVIPPLLHYSRSSPDRSLWGTALILWRAKDITSSTTLGLPLFYDFHSYHERRITMFLPLFFRYRNHVANTSYTFAPLVYRRTGPDDSTTVAFPLVWDFRGGDRRTTVVFPFYAGFRRPNWEGRYIFPNIWYRTGLGADEGTSRFWIFPLWESAVKRPGDYMWEALLGLFGWERIGRNRYLKLFFIPFELTPAPAATRAAWYGKPPPLRNQRARSLSTQTW
jgi:hypothetical protein